MENKKIISIIIPVFFTLTFLLWGGVGGFIFAGQINMIDEGQYLAWLSHLRDGEKLYKDMYVTYGPLQVYPLYLLLHLFEPTIWMTKAYLVAGAIPGLLAANSIMKLFHIKKWIQYLGLFLLTIFPVLQLRASIGLIFIYLLMLIIEKYTNTRIFMLGVVAALAFLISPEIGLIVSCLGFSYLILMFVAIKQKHQMFQRWIFFTLGILCIILPFILWSSADGWFYSYIQVTKDVMTSFSGVNSPNGKNFPSPALFSPEINYTYLLRLMSKETLLYYGLILYLGALIYAVCQLVIGKDKKAIELFILVIYGLVLYQVLISRPGVAHFFFVSASLIIVFLYMLHVLVVKFQSMNKKHDKLVALFLIFLAFGFIFRLIRLQLPSIEKNLQNISMQKSSNKTEKLGSFILDKTQDDEIAPIQKYIDKKTLETDSIFILSNEPSLYFLLKRDNPTRFDLPYIAHTKDKRNEILHDLKVKKPLYILEDSKDWPVDEVSNRRRLPEIVQFINQNYKKEIMIGDTILYRKI